MATEVLHGGLCDGLLIEKVQQKIVYAGRFGDGRVQIYVRGEDGKLRYSSTAKVESNRSPTCRAN